jgi:exopolyphosphatase/guanosine-5'-triphosphate,3'-diphosphate pyrophosphatase
MTRGEILETASAPVKAVIDIGSNSVKLRVARRQGRVLDILFDATEPVVLLPRLEDGLIGEDAIQRGSEATARMTARALKMGARPRLVGTMALRGARNAEDFVRQVRARTGITVEVLSWEEEARLAWLGAVRSMGETGDSVVVDIGGGSTEFIFGTGSRVVSAHSFPVGTARLPGAPDSLEEAEKHVEGVFAGFVRPAKQARSLIGLGGGLIVLASVKRALPSFTPLALDGVLLTRADVTAQLELYASMSPDERAKIAGMPPKRSDIALAGACIARCALDALEADSLRFSLNGLRHGLLVEMFEGRSQGAG